MKLYREFAHPSHLAVSYYVRVKEWRCQAEHAPLLFRCQSRPLSVASELYLHDVMSVMGRHNSGMAFLLQIARTLGKEIKYTSIALHSNIFESAATYTN